MLRRPSSMTTCSSIVSVVSLSRMLSSSVAAATSRWDMVRSTAVSCKCSGIGREIWKEGQATDYASH